MTVKFSISKNPNRSSQRKFSMQPSLRKNTLIIENVLLRIETKKSGGLLLGTSILQSVPTQAEAMALIGMITTKIFRKNNLQNKY
jgi:hypothetical protein